MKSIKKKITMSTTKKSYCELDKKGMGYNFDGCPHPDTLYALKGKLDTLEVKEVNLDKIINDYFKDWKFDEELDIMVKPNNYSASFTDLKEIAKHFFELGLKAAQKGE